MCIRDRGSPEQCKGADKWLVPITTNNLSLTINHLLNMLEKNEMIFGVRAVIEAIQAGREMCIRDRLR